MCQLPYSGSNQVIQIVTTATEFVFKKCGIIFLQISWCILCSQWGILPTELLNVVSYLVSSSGSNSLRRKLETLKYDTACRLVFPIQGQNRTHQFRRTLMTWLSAHNTHKVNFLQSINYVMHRQFNIQQLYALPTLYLCVLCLSENKQRLVPLTA